MPREPSINKHAAERLKERIDVDKSWLADVLKQGKFVWLKGTGNSRNEKMVRSGHLIFHPDKNKYFVVVMDDHNRLAITVLTEDMALNSSWAKGVDQKAKLKAKRLALGEEAVHDVNFLLLYAKDRGKLSASVKVKTLTYDWKLVILSIYKTDIEPNQFDIDRKCCTLSNQQMEAVCHIIKEKIASKQMRPYGELSIRTGRGKTVLISNQLELISDLETAELAKRWEI